MVRKSWMVLALLLVVAGVLGYLWLRGQGGAVALRTGTPPPVEVESLEAVPGGVRVVWAAQPVRDRLRRSRSGRRGSRARRAEGVDDPDQTSFLWEGLTEAEHCFRVRAVAGEVQGAFGAEQCVARPAGRGRADGHSRADADADGRAAGSAGGAVRAAGLVRAVGQLPAGRHRERRRGRRDGRGAAAGGCAGRAAQEQRGLRRVPRGRRTGCPTWSCSPTAARRADRQGAVRRVPVRRRRSASCRRGLQ